MLFISTMNHYLAWHYSRAFAEIFHVWLNFIWFVVHFFSIPQLMSSWFAPWKRIVTNRGNTWNMEDFAGFLIIGLLSRIVGFIMRSLVIISGFIILLLLVVFGFAFYAFWIASPLIIISLLGFGITMLVT